MLQYWCLLSLLLSLVGCAIRAASPGEVESGYTYIPLDPFPVTLLAGQGCVDRTPDRKTLLTALPDNAARMLTEKFEVSGKIIYGPSNVGGDGATYRVTTDYIYSDTINRRVFIKKTMQRQRKYRLNPLLAFLKGQAYEHESQEYKKAEGEEGPYERQAVPIGYPTDSDVYVPGSEVYTIATPPPSPKPGSGVNYDTFAKYEEETKKFLEEHKEFSEFNIPIYVGLGLRVSANIYSVKGNANIAGLGAIGAEAQLENLKGSLVIQTLGVNGKSVTAALPIQSELNPTTTQNAIVAVSSIKALLHSDETWIMPRIVGLYLPFPGGKPLVNALISQLSKEQLVWIYQCRSVGTEGLMIR